MYLRREGIYYEGTKVRTNEGKSYTEGIIYSSCRTTARVQVARERAFQDKRDHWIDPDVTKFLRRKGSSLPRHRSSRVFRQNRCAIDEPRRRTFFHNSPFVSGLADMLTFCQGIHIRGDTSRKHFTLSCLSLRGAGNCSPRQTKEVKVLYRRYKVGSSSFCGKSRQTHLFL